MRKRKDKDYSAKMFAEYVKKNGTESLKKANEIASKNASLFMQEFDENRRQLIRNGERIYYG